MASPVYEQLIAEITEEDEVKVFDILLKADGARVSRAELVKQVYGKEFDTNQLSLSKEDRKIRRIIHTLREMDFPIVSSSDEPGYTMKGSSEEMDAYIAEQASRKEKLQDNIDHAYRSKAKALLVKNCREELRYVPAAKPAVQLSFMSQQAEA